MDPPHPRGHNLAPGFDFVRMKVIRCVVELQFKTVNWIVVQSLLDEGKSFLAHLLMFEVEAGEPGEVSI